jgi:hypothetical protein
MFKTAMTMLVAFGLFSLTGQATPNGAWQLELVSKANAHVSNWEHYHQCNPSPCKRLRDRHKMGTGSVTESQATPPNGLSVR